MKIDGRFEASPHRRQIAHRVWAIKSRYAWKIHALPLAMWSIIQAFLYEQSRLRNHRNAIENLYGL